MTGFLFGSGVWLVIFGILNWERAVEASFTVLLAFVMGVGTGMAGGAINAWVDRLARR